MYCIIGKNLQFQKQMTTYDINLRYFCLIESQIVLNSNTNTIRFWEFFFFLEIKFCIFKSEYFL